jgi:predicted nucleotidyltransferase
MQPDLDDKRIALASICRRHGVVRLEVFGSAAKAKGFDPIRSDIDFLVTFEPAFRNDLVSFAELKEELEQLLGRRVDLVEREAVETSRNFIRRRAILNQARTVYA